MPSLRSALPFALVLAAGALADAPATTSALRAGVDARLATGKVPEPRARTLRRIAEDLADDATLAAEAASARRTASRVRTTFPHAVHLQALLRDAGDAIEARADVDRVALGPAVPDLAPPEAAILLDGLGDVARLLGRADASRSTASRLSFLAKACRRIEAARTASGAVPVAGAAPRPDFSLVDVNRSSDSYGRSVTPRSRLGSVSAWYFGHST